MTGALDAGKAAAAGMAAIAVGLLMVLAYLSLYALGLALIVFIGLHILQFLGVSIPFAIIGGVLL